MRGRGTATSVTRWSSRPASARPCCRDPAALLGRHRQQQAAGQDRHRLRQAARRLHDHRRDLVRPRWATGRRGRCGASGAKIAGRLSALGIETVRDLAASDTHALVGEFGPTMGPWFHRLGRGVDTSPVDATPWVARAHGREETFQTDLEWREVPGRRASATARALEDIDREGRPATRVLPQDPLPQLLHPHPLPQAARAEPRPRRAGRRGRGAARQGGAGQAGAAARGPAGDGAAGGRLRRDRSSATQERGRTVEGGASSAGHGRRTPRRRRRGRRRPPRADSRETGGRRTRPRRRPTPARWPADDVEVEVDARARLVPDQRAAR